MKKECEYLCYVVPSDINNSEFEFLDKHYLEHDSMNSAEWSVEDKMRQICNQFEKGN